MKLSSVFLLAAATSVSAQRKYNITSASASGQLEKYSCMTTDKWLHGVSTCIHGAEKYGNAHDGCAYDDWMCHCANFQVNSDIINPLIFPKSLGGNSTCTDPEFYAAFASIVDMCNFFNATGYAAYAGCRHPLKFSTQKVLDIWAKEPVVISH